MRRVIVYAPHPPVQRWIDEELVGEPCDVAPMESIDQAIEALLVRDGVRKVLVVDVDMLDADGLAALDGVWSYGTPLVGLGQVSREMRDALHFTYVVRRPLGSEKLRAIISGLCDGGDTIETNAIEPPAGYAVAG